MGCTKCRAQLSLNGCICNNIKHRCRDVLHCNVFRRQYTCSQFWQGRIDQFPFLSTEAISHQGPMAKKSSLQPELRVTALLSVCLYYVRQTDSCTCGHVVQENRGTSWKTALNMVFKSHGKKPVAYGWNTICL